MLFIVEAGELIFITHFRISGSKPFIVKAGDLIKIRFNFQSALQEFLVEVIEAFTDGTKLVKAFGIVESVL